jgi:hypothetical protein
MIAACLPPLPPTRPKALPLPLSNACDTDAHVLVQRIERTPREKGKHVRQQ